MIATTISQSKHLLELGLPKETSDMSYSEEYFGKDKDGNDEWCWRLNACKFVAVEGVIPAWSLSALLDVMPSKESKWCTLMHAQDFYWCTFEKSDGTIIKEFCSNNYTDAAYEMVCWLLEQGLIKKGGNNETY